MAEYSQVEITDALAAVIESIGADIVGVVLTDRRTCEEDAEALALLQSQNDGEARGWLVTLMQISEVDTNNSCEIQQTLTFALEAVAPYTRRRPDGVTSESLFRAMLADVFAAVRADRQLGLDGRVWHRLIQSAEDFKIMSWEGTGQDAILTHYAKLKIEVTNAVFV